jgi:hypothetical protein
MKLNVYNTRQLAGLGDAWGGTPDGQAAYDPSVFDEPAQQVVITGQLPPRPAQWLPLLLALGAILLIAKNLKD